MEDPKAMEACKPLWDSVASLFKGDDAKESSAAEQAVMEMMVANMVKVMPLRAAINFGDGSVTYEQLDAILEEINRA